MSRRKSMPALLSASKGARAQAMVFRRVLRRLTEPGAYLAGEEGEAAPFGLYLAKNKHSRAVMRLEAPLVSALRAAGLVLAIPGRLNAYAMAEEGRLYLERAQAAEDPFAAQHRDMGGRYIAEPHDTGRVRVVNLNESPLSWLTNRKGADGKPFLDAEHAEAGERLRSDYTRAQLMPSLTVNWEQPMAQGARASEGLTLSESAMAARKRVGEALAAVGPELESVLVEVCCHLQGLEAVERALQLPPRTGKVVLRIALAALARHYGFIRPRQKAGLRAWSG